MAKKAPKRHAPKPKAKPKPRYKTVRKRVLVRPGRPGSPGVPSPTPAPFLESDDEWDVAEAENRWAQELADLRERASEARAEAEYGVASTEENRKQGTRSTNSSLAERGLLQSSIRQLRLADIDASASRQAEMYRSRARAAEAAFAARGGDIATIERPRLNEMMGRRATENAGKLAASSPWAQEPVGATTPQYKTTTKRVKIQAPTRRPQRIKSTPYQAGVGGAFRAVKKKGKK